MQIAVTFLAGRSSMHGDTGDQGEYPPQQRRLYEALVSAAHNVQNPLGFEWLDWLEQQGAPRIDYCAQASSILMMTYEPYQNEIELDDKGNRYRRSKRFDAQTWLPDVPTHLIYSYAEDPPSHLLEAAKDVCSAVPYLGQSCSPALVRLDNEARIEEPIRLEPTKAGTKGEMIHRVAGPGRRQALERSHKDRMLAIAAEIATARRKGKRVDPYDDGILAQTAETMTSGALAARTYFLGTTRSNRNECERLVPYHRAALRPAVWRFERFAFKGDEHAVRHPSIDGSLFPALTTALRRNFIQQAIVAGLCGGPTGCDSRICGHETDGRPASGEHVGFIALHDLRRFRATGRIFGWALAVPSSLPSELRAKVANLGADLSVTVDGVRYDSVLIGGPTADVPWAVRSADHESSSEVWETATPAIPWRHFTDSQRRRLRKPEKAGEVIHEAVSLMCERAALPRPIEATWEPAGAFPHSPWAKSLAERGQTSRLPAMHVRMRFDRLVKGPVLIGAEMWKGYGLCLPPQ
jgi:CRISPR-associated protein Csb2